jgi:hypothetical protein
MNKALYNFPKVNPITCVWIWTGDPRQPLACLWMDANPRNPNAALAASTETRVEGVRLCA